MKSHLSVTVSILASFGVQFSCLLPQNLLKLLMRWRSIKAGSTWRRIDDSPRRKMLDLRSTAMLSMHVWYLKDVTTTLASKSRFCFLQHLEMPIHTQHVSTQGLGTFRVLETITHACTTNKSTVGCISSRVPCMTVPYGILSWSQPCDVQ